MRRRAAVAVLFACSCHITSQLELSRPGKRATVEHRDQIVGRHATIQLTAEGRFRFAEEVTCASEVGTEMQQSIETHRDPNLATFVVGVVATAVGAVLVASTALGSDPTGSPLFYSGLLGLAVGLPFSVGPWIGRTTDLAAGDPLPPVTTAGPVVPCGDHPITAPSAIVTLNDTDVRGTIDPDGVFSVSPYELVDAFDGDAAAHTWNVGAILDTGNGNGQITTIGRVFENTALAGHAGAWLATQRTFDRTIEPIKIVPGIVAGTLRVSLTQTHDGPAIRVVLPLRNDGPGDAWAVRGQIASSVRAIDARMLYVGKLVKGAAVSPEIIIPIAPDVGSALRGATILVSVQLKDAHGTAPETPVRFNGQVLVDLPRN